MGRGGQSANSILKERNGRRAVSCEICLGLKDNSEHSAYMVPPQFTGFILPMYTRQCYL